MTIFFIIVFGLYGACILILAFGWARLSDVEKNKPVTHDYFISVIIPFRNETAHLQQLINDLSKLNYSIHNFEIILIDDHSTDSPASVIDKVSVSNLKLLNLPLEQQGKKAAIDFGIRQAKGAIIVTTDADCRVPINWLDKINTQFQNENLKMLVGPVRIDSSSSFFSKIQALEFASLIGTSGSTLGLGTPTMCNGANLSYLKSAYEEVKGFEGNEKIPSGDDEFLMRKIATRWKYGVSFLNDSDSVVSTASQHSVTDFIHQRLRWASKWKYNSSLLTKSVALVVLCFHISFLSSYICAWTGVLATRWFIILWSSKMFMEMIFLFPVCRFLQLRWHWISFIVLQFAYSFYVVIIGVLSQVKKYTWKGR